jgi:two-component system alkaline phosphatase synthesis response regulator PhoP
MTQSILVVDDDRAIAAVLADLLNEEGLTASYVCSGLEALERLSSEPVDLVISDVSMPGIGGIELVQRLRDRGDQTPVVLMSGYVTGITLEGVRFVPKPFDFHDLLGIVEQTVAPQTAKA